ncbi:hypothetical protein FRB90_006259, partial [Tulasnella sp. 427]
HFEGLPSPVLLVSYIALQLTDIPLTDLFDDYMEARSATPVGAVCPLPVTDTLGIETLLVSESPRPLVDPELPAEDLTVLRLALDAVAATLPVNEVKEPEEPLSGSRDFLIELAPGPA